MNFANIITKEIVTGLNPILVTPTGTITGADIRHYASLGWRKVVSVDAPTSGYRVTSYQPVEIDALTCRLSVKTQVNIADEAAAQAAAQAAAAAAEVVATKDAAKLLAEVATTETGRVIRAFMELTLQEINALRTKASLSTYTQTQFLNALKTKIDAQS